MATIINEMEVVTEPPQSPPQEGVSAESEQQAASSVQGLSPLDVESLLRMRYQRMARVRAD